MMRPAPPPSESAPADITATIVTQNSSVAAPSPPNEVTTIIQGAAAAAPTAVSAATDSHCKAVAGQRKKDAAVNGYDDDMQQNIFDGTYKNCLDWAAQHPGADY
jgi:hypothetical protein